MNRHNREPLIALGLVIAILVSGWLFVVSPRLSDRDALVAQQTIITRTDALETRKLEGLRNQFRSLAVLEQHVSDLQAGLPAQAQTTEFIATIGAIAAVNSVDVTAVVPGTPTLFVPKAVASTKAVPSPGKGELYTIQVSVTASGTNSGTDKFLAQLQMTGRLFIVNSVGTSHPAIGISAVTIVGYIFVVVPVTGGR